MQQDREEKKARRKHNHRGRKVLLVIVLLLILVGGLAGFAYTKGYGWPTQETVVTDFFNAASNGDDISGYLSEAVSDDAKTQINAIMPVVTSVEIDGVDRTMSSSEVLATANLNNGGTQDYVVSLVRDGLGWKVTGVELSFASTATSQLATTADASTAEAEAESADAASTESTDAAESSEAETATDASESTESTEATE